jgi:hypothetical protein
MRAQDERCGLVSREALSAWRARDRQLPEETRERERTDLFLIAFTSCTPAMRASSVSKCVTARSVGRCHSGTERALQQREQLGIVVIGLGADLHQLDEIRRDLHAQIARADPPKGFRSATSRKVCRFDFLLRAIWISASKNRSSLPANGLFARRAPLATVCTQPNEFVHQWMIRLVSLSLRLRSKMAVVLSMAVSGTRQISRTESAR